MTDTLAKICATTRNQLSASIAKIPLMQMRQMAEAAPPPRDFIAAMRTHISRDGCAFICESKKASPSGGVIQASYDPAANARAYAAGGAACLSVLTDTPYFQGNLIDLEQARNACDLPVLRKDFMLDPYQIYEARAHGADCILLIMACLTASQARDMEALALQLGMAVLLESHDARELDAALNLQSPLIGINNRNLRTLKTDLKVTEDLIHFIPTDRICISESGIKTADDVNRLQAAGAQGFLVGESLLRQTDLTVALQALVSF